MRRKALAPWLLLSLLSSCARSYPDLVPRIGLLPAKALVGRSSLIVLARVTAVETLGPSVRRAGVLTRLWRVHADLEQVVKGKISGKTLIFYLYNYDPRVLQNGGFERIWPPTRGFFFLCTEHGALRATTDLMESHIEFPRHGLPHIAPFAADAPDHKIAALLLTEDDAGLRADFAQHLGYAIAQSLQVAGFRFTRGLAVPLLNDPDVRVRDAACEAMVNLMFGDDQCLADVAYRDLQGVEKLRRQRALVLAKIAGAEASGQPWPLLDQALGVDRSNRAEVLYFLQTLSLSASPVIASSAHRELRLLANGALTGTER